MHAVCLPVSGSRHIVLRRLQHNARRLNFISLMLSMQLNEAADEATIRKLRDRIDVNKDDYAVVSDCAHRACSFC